MPDQTGKHEGARVVRTVEGLPPDVYKDGGATRTVQQAEATTYALRLVKAERIRQDTLKAEGRFEFTCADDGLSRRAA